MIRKLALAALLASAAFPAGAQDFGQRVQEMLTAESSALFGIQTPLAATAAATPTEGYRTAGDQPGAAIDVAGGLTASFLTREAANAWDQMAFYPAENPTHLIGCIEGAREEIAPGKFNPAVQRVSLADGKVETIVRGTTSCDGIRTTPWGTVIFTEERTDGGFYEIMDPLATSEVTIVNRMTGETSDAARVVRRPALPLIAWEGIAVLDNGIVYGGDELRPGTGTPNANGGAIFKFVPSTLYSGGAIASLDQSPLTGGTTYAMQVSCVANQAQFGQGCEVGKAGWIEVAAATATADAEAKGATGYYRPEDLHSDPVFAGEGVRFCWTNTENEEAGSFAEVVCAIDSAPASVEGLTTVVNRFVEGDMDFNSFDNLDFQPGTGILYVIEDHPNGDVWACLPDGADRDIKSDGCIKVLSVKDTSAEPTGFIFSADGMTAYVSIQHSNDAGMAKVDDYGTDDLIAITGFAPPSM